MSRQTLESPKRRRVLAGVGAGLVAAGVGVAPASADSEIGIVLDNVGANAYVLEDADEDVGPEGEENPTLTLTVGSRYRVENRGWDAHPLAFRDGDDELLNQDGPGSFEDDDDVDWVDDGDELSFTLTEELADELDNYVCTIHPSMEGSIEAREGEAVFEVDELDPAEATIEQADPLTVSATVTNAGDENGETPVELRLDGDAVATQEVALDDGESETVVFEDVDTAEIEPGEYTHSVWTADDEATGTLTVDTAAETAVSFVDQATASSTFTAGEPTEPGVLVEVSTDRESAIVVTYEDGDELVIAGLELVDELDGEEVVVAVEDDGGFPGEHVAHAIPADELSGEYAPGEAVSAETADAVAANDAATVHQGTLEFEDQTADEPVEEGDVMAVVDVSLDDGAGGETPYVVDVHPTDDGELVGEEFVGASDVLAGAVDGAEIVAERVPDDGTFNELPFEGTGTFVAMIHVVDDGSAPGDAASPGSFPVVANVDAAAGPVPGGVTDDATVTVEAAADDEDDEPVDDEPADDDPADDVVGDDEPADDDPADDEPPADADDDGPGFGPIAGLAGLGGLAAYAYRTLERTTRPESRE